MFKQVIFLVLSLKSIFCSIHYLLLYVYILLFRDYDQIKTFLIKNSNLKFQSLMKLCSVSSIFKYFLSMIHLKGEIEPNNYLIIIDR